MIPRETRHQNIIGFTAICACGYWVNGATCAEELPTPAEAPEWHLAEHEEENHS